jgi:hypothetical protein
VILLWGLPGDTPLALVRAALDRRGAPVAFVDQRRALETEIDLIVDGTLCGEVRAAQQSVLLSDVTAAYLRPYSSTTLPEVERAGRFSPTWQHAVGLDDVLTAWADLSSACIVNRPAAMATNSSKPYQSEVIRTFGFDVPATLITTDPDAVREFCLEHGEVVYKSLSGVRSIVSRLDGDGRERLGRVRWCPTQFQQWIDGVDWRVHVIGESVFGCEVLSAADDYRYASRQGQTVDLRSVDVPDDIAERCVGLTRALGLRASGIDLRRDREGRWYCFEANPSPAFSYYQRGTGQPIDEAIAALLIAATGRADGAVKGEPGAAYAP